MSRGQRLLRDAWVRACLVIGALMLALATVVGLPWALWLAWAYVVLLSVVDVLHGPGRVSPSDTAHVRGPEDLWQTRPDE